jgi:hypothetical protein
LAGNDGCSLTEVSQGDPQTRKQERHLELWQEYDPHQVMDWRGRCHSKEHTTPETVSEPTVSALEGQCSFQAWQREVEKEVSALPFPSKTHSVSTSLVSAFLIWSPFVKTMCDSTPRGEAFKLKFTSGCCPERTDFLETYAYVKFLKAPRAGTKPQKLDILHSLNRTPSFF